VAHNTLPAVSEPAPTVGDEIAEYLERSPGPHSPKEIHAAIGGSYDTVRSTLITMRDRGELTQPRRGVYVASGGTKMAGDSLTDEMGAGPSGSPPESGAYDLNETTTRALDMARRLYPGATVDHVTMDAQGRLVSATLCIRVQFDDVDALVKTAV